MAKKQYQVKEHSDHYEIDDGQGPFKIAKQAIPDHLHEEIRKMAKGGPVEEGNIETAEDRDIPGPGLITELGQELFPPTPADIAKSGLQEVSARQPAIPAPEVQQSANREELGMYMPALRPVQAQKPAGTVGEGGAIQQARTAEKGQEAAIQADVKLQQDKAAAVTVQRHQQMEALDAFNKSEDAKAADHAAKEAQAIQEFKAGKINPNQLWQDSDFGSKATALIGVVLGGIGGAMTGGPNQALGVVQKQIDRSIDAQVKNKQNEESMINVLTKQGYDMRQARGLAEARMKGRFADQIESTLGDFAGQQAQVGGQKMIADLRSSQLQIEAKVRAEGQESTLRALNIKQAQFGVENAEIQRVALANLRTTGTIPPELLPYLSPDLQKRYGPNAGEMGVRAAAAEVQEEPANPLTAKLPQFLSGSAKQAEEQALRLTENYFRMQGVPNPSKRSLLSSPVYETAKLATGRAFGTEASRARALQFFTKGAQQAKRGRALGVTPTPASQPSPEGEGT